MVRTGLHSRLERWAARVRKSVSFLSAKFARKDLSKPSQK
jgi:hypothetical protein